MSDANDRARVAYETFRSGLKDPNQIPGWLFLMAWQRDMMLVAYLQGRVDAHDQWEKAVTGKKVDMVITDEVAHVERKPIDQDPYHERKGE
jgi:hypothetical protein